MFRVGDIVQAAAWSEGCGYPKDHAGRTGRVSAERSKSGRLKVHFGGRSVKALYVREEDLLLFRPRKVE